MIVTDKTCEQHGLYYITIINSGKRPWNLGCPQCNFIEWKKIQEEEKKNNNGKIKPKKITDITGIGKVTAEKLTEAGVSDVKDLVDVNPLELAKTTNIPVKKIRSWQDAVA